MIDEDNRQERAVPVLEEELVTGTQRVKTGSVRVRKKVHRLRRTVDLPTVRDVVEVTRRPINQVVETAPQTREEGDTLIIPVVEEEIVVHKRLVLREEIRIRRSRSQTNVSKEVTLQREVATVERLDASGRVTSEAVTDRGAGIDATGNEPTRIEPIGPAAPALPVAPAGPAVDTSYPLLRKKKGLLE